MIDEAIGERIAKGDAQLKDVHAGGIECHGEIFRGGKIGVACADVGYETFLACGTQIGKALVDSIHPRGSLSIRVDGSEPKPFQCEERAHCVNLRTLSRDNF